MTARTRIQTFVVAATVVGLLAFAGVRFMTAPRVGNWMTDLDAAKERSVREGKPLLVQFTGDDWCPFCKMLKARVLSSSTFADASRNVVLVYLDYPTAGEPTSEMVRANPALSKLMALKATHSIDGFPTVITYDAKGTQLSKIVGYGFESPRDYIARLNLSPP
jgi:thioredoxin-related protein